MNSNMLVRKVAKEIAGIFFDQNRTNVFRAMHPNQDAYVAGHWPHFVNLAKQQLATMLTMKGTPEYQKEEIYEALVDQYEKGTRANAKEVLQATLEPRDKDDNRFINDNPRMPVHSPRE